MYYLEDLIDEVKFGNEVKLDGKWYPKRPLTYAKYSLLTRLRDAYYVLIGKADAVIWPEDEDVK